MQQGAAPLREALYRSLTLGCTSCCCCCCCWLPLPKLLLDKSPPSDPTTPPLVLLPPLPKLPDCNEPDSPRPPSRMDTAAPRPPGPCRPLTCCRIGRLPQGPSGLWLRRRRRELRDGDSRWASRSSCLPWRPLPPLLLRWWFLAASLAIWRSGSCRPGGLATAAAPSPHGPSSGSMAGSSSSIRLSNKEADWGGDCFPPPAPGPRGGEGLAACATALKKGGCTAAGPLRVPPRSAAGEHPHPGRESNGSGCCCFRYKTCGGRGARGDKKNGVAEFSDEGTAVPTT